MIVILVSTTLNIDPMSLQKLTGTIENLQCKRLHANFVFVESTKSVMGVTALAAGLAGLSGQAIALAQNAESLEEEADYLEFTLNGQPVKGWVWRNPFKNGNTVEVAVEWINDHFEAYAIARPSDSTIALYPHCSRGSWPQVFTAIQWWLWVTTVFLVVCFAMVLFVGLFQDIFSTMYIIDSLLGRVGGLVAILSYGFSGLFTIVQTSKWMKFVKIAERSFTALGLENPTNIDLVKRTKESFKTSPNRDRYLSVCYFKY